MKMQPRAMLSVAFLAIAISASAALPAGPASAISAERAHRVVLEEAAANRRTARRDARRRLQLFASIPGVVPRPRRPSGIGGRLRGRGPIPGDSRQVHAVAFFTFRHPPAAIFRRLHRHPLRGSAARENYDGFVYWEHGPPGTRGATAVVRAASRLGGGSAVRVDIYDSWELPRSPDTRLPSGLRYLELVIFRGRDAVPVGGAKPLPPRRTGTADRRLVDDLVHTADRLPAFQLFRPPSCGPITPGITEHVVFKFRSARRGPVLVRLSQHVPIGLCDPLELRLGNARPYALEGGQELLRQAHRLIAGATPRPLA